MRVEYRTFDWFTHYGLYSIGWESDVRNHTTPTERAETWMNEQAQDGWTLTSFISDRPTRVTVVMQREIGSTP